MVIKPNGQWMRHGMTNTDVLRGLIDVVLSIPGFAGEVIVAENHHCPIDNDRGWTTEERNGRFNLNELVQYYEETGFANVSKSHWHDGGPNPRPLHFGGGNGGVVQGPEDGDGYVWTDIDYTYKGRTTKMTYPVFTSSFSGVTVDLKNGAWRNGKFTGQPVKLINVSGLNHHGTKFGVTASLKNYLGIVDLTCGEHGPEPPGFYNFHYIAVGWPNRGWAAPIERCIRHPWVRQSKQLTRAFRRFGPVYPEAMGGAIGCFIRTIRRADLSIIAAEHVGPEGRLINPVRVGKVLASVDGVALDYYAAKHVLHPLGGRYSTYNDPDLVRGPFRRFLDGCAMEGGGTLDERLFDVHETTG